MWSARSELRRAVGAVVAVLLLVACGAGSSDDNLTIADRFPNLPGVELVSTESHGYCLGDSCRFGDDGTGTLLVYDVVEPGVGDLGVIEAVANEFPAWVLHHERICLSANPNGCEELVLQATLSDGEALVGFNFDNWPRRFEIYVDAHDGGRLAGWVSE